MTRWLRAVLVIVGLMAGWFALGVATYEDDPQIDELQVSVGNNSPWNLLEH